jgi:hypothetical protein
MTRDPEFSTVAVKKETPRSPSSTMQRLIRGLIYAHLAAATLTAAPDLYRNAYHLVTGGYDTEVTENGLSVLAFVSLYLFVPIEAIAVGAARLKGREFWRVVLAITAVAVFHLIAGLPMVQ